MTMEVEGRITSVPAIPVELPSGEIGRPFAPAGTSDNGLVGHIPITETAALGQPTDEGVGVLGFEVYLPADPYELVRSTLSRLTKSDEVRALLGDADRLHTIIAALPETQRHIFIRRIGYMESMPAIAEVLGISPDAAKKIQARSLKVVEKGFGLPLDLKQLKHSNKGVLIEDFLIPVIVFNRDQAAPLRPGEIRIEDLVAGAPTILPRRPRFEDQTVPVEELDLRDPEMIFRWSLRPVAGVLLRHEEEIELGKAKDAGLAAELALSTAPNSRKQELQMLVDNGKLAQRQLTESNIRLVLTFANIYSSASGVPILDLVQDGVMGLMRAVKKYDWKKGFKFSTYATRWILQYIIRALPGDRIIHRPEYLDDWVTKLDDAAAIFMLENGRRPSRSELAELTGLTPEQIGRAIDVVAVVTSLDRPIREGEDDSPAIEFVEDEEDDLDPAIQLVFSLLQDEVEVLLTSLPARLERVLRLRFGNGYREHTLREVGEKFGVSRERVRQMETEALEKFVEVLQRNPKVAEKLKDLIEGD